MLKDIYGNHVSTSSRAALAKFDQALRQIRTYHGDPIATLDAALEHDPQFALANVTRAMVLAQVTDAMFADEVQRSLRAAAPGAMNDRERGHFAGAMAWAEGRFNESTSIFGRIAQENPRDVLALQNAHVGCFFTGRQFDLRDWPLQTMRAHKHGDESWHAILGMAAFGLEECGDYARAEALGVEAIDAESTDAWAAHAVAHVHEMRGNVEEGVGWLEGTADGWSTDCGFAYHNWWHLGLLHLDRLDHKAALKLYDERVRPKNDANVVLEMLDASAMLWRLHLEGVDTGDRFERLARVWEQKAEDGIYAFNDLHAIMAFLGAGRMGDAERTLKAMRLAAEGKTDNAAMTSEIGLPLAEGFIAFAAGRNVEAVEKIARVRGMAQRFGGSHAQRDVLALTALQAAIRGGMQSTAEAFAAERLAHKPQSPWAQRLSRQAKNASAGARAAAN
ncbi:MAG: tetratricopeptide repeat protein [Hyphomonadaceae bacterium]|nr:tetratricopeptide repeat protein [Hyphomonadaceae bacterium]